MSRAKVPSEAMMLLPHLLYEFEAVRDLAEENTERGIHTLTFGSCHRPGPQQYTAGHGTYAYWNSVSEPPAEIWAQRISRFSASARVAERVATQVPLRVGRDDARDATSRQPA